MTQILPPDLGLQCDECGVSGEQAWLQWDSHECAWLCQRCGDYLDALREGEERAAAAKEGAA